MYDNTTYDLTSQWLAEWKCGIYSQALHDLLCIRTYAIQNPCRKFQNPLSAIAAAAGSMLRIAPLLHAALYYMLLLLHCVGFTKSANFVNFLKTESTIVSNLNFFFMIIVSIMAKLLIFQVYILVEGICCSTQQREDLSLCVPNLFNV